MIDGESSWRQVSEFLYISVNDQYKDHISSDMGEVLYKHNDGVMFEHIKNMSNMTDMTNSPVTKTAAAASNETSGVLTMSSVSLLYQYFAFMSYFMGKRNTLKSFAKVQKL